MLFNYETETYASGGSETKTSSEHGVRYDKMVTFEKTLKYAFSIKSYQVFLGLYSTI